MPWFERMFRGALGLLMGSTLVVPLSVAAGPVDAELRRVKDAAPVALADPMEKKDAASKALQVRRWNPRAGLSQLAGNSTPDTAQYLDLNTQWSDTLDVQDEEDWYYVHVPSGGKVTAFLNTVNDASLDYDLYAFSYDATTFALTLEAQSLFGPAHYEQTSVTGAAGSYFFFMVHAYQGADPVNPYTLVVLHSATPDVAEPDDNPWQAQSANSGLNATRTLDNGFDEDWVVFNVGLQNNYKFSLSTAAAATYQLQIFSNPGGAPAATVNKNASATYSLPPGTWYVRVLSLDVVEPATPYTLRVGVAPASIVLDRVDTENGYSGYHNFGFGLAWRVRYFATFVGSLTDIYGQPVANAPVDITVFTPSTYQAQTDVSGASDANGQFTITTNVPHAWGRESRKVYLFREYYDRASFTITSGTTSLSRAVYHYAHSVYEP
ncbi:hypothetical protein HV824_33955 [Myxococcus sp. AM009]|uniref:hypothetical protein n=1 Tax=Myxococcus sp. AM009 TaxID=2745137 RepID=UPI0015957DA6|nr:hypothetical protein [Myxococcus sp. AM009]NVJ03089.1 hypothetical protein [Myxococcus sp. AM009]